MDEAEKRFYAAHHIINDKNIFRNIEFFLNRFAVSQMAHLCRVTVDKDLPDGHGVIRQEKLSIQSPGSTFEIILRGLQFKMVAGGDCWVGELDLTFDGSTVLKGTILKERDNLTARYVPPYRLRSDIHKFDAYDWIDRLDELVKRMQLLERDRDHFRSLSSIKTQAENIDLSKYPLEAIFIPVRDDDMSAQPGSVVGEDTEDRDTKDGDTKDGAAEVSSAEETPPMTASDQQDAVIVVENTDHTDGTEPEQEQNLDPERLTLGESPRAH